MNIKLLLLLLLLGSSHIQSGRPKPLPSASMVYPSHQIFIENEEGKLILLLAVDKYAEKFNNFELEERKAIFKYYQLAKKEKLAAEKKYDISLFSILTTYFAYNTETQTYNREFDWAFNKLTTICPKGAIIKSKK